MGLEAASWINQLDSANPLGTDQKGQGDDHLRLIKAVLLASFPNIGGAVTASHTTLNNTVAAVAALPTLASGEGAPTCTNGTNFTQSGTLHHKYIRIGSFVVVFALVSGNCGASASELGTVFELTLPIASNLGAATDLFGFGMGYDGGGTGVTREMLITANTVNDRMKAQFRAPAPSDIANTQLVYVYKVI